MDNQAGTQFRFEPGCLGRHDITGIGNIHQLLHGDRIKRQRDLHLATVHTTLQFTQPTDTAYEIDTLIRTKIFYTQNFIQNQVGRDRHIQDTDRIVIVVCALLGCQRIPFSCQIEGEIMQSYRFINIRALFFHDKVLFQFSQKFLFRQAVQVFHHTVIVDNR